MRKPSTAKFCNTEAVSSSCKTTNIRRQTLSKSSIGFPQAELYAVILLGNTVNKKQSNLHTIITCHCVKSVRIRRYSGPHFPAFRLNTERYGVFLRIQFKCGKMRTRITANTYTFHAVYNAKLKHRKFIS